MVPARFAVYPRRGNTISEKRLRDHFHEHCESLTPTGFSLRAMAPCTPSHRRDVDIGIDDIDSIAHIVAVCQEGARKKARQKDFLFTQKKQDGPPRCGFPVVMKNRMGAPEVQTISHLSRKKSFWGESGETFIKKPPQTHYSKKGWKRKAAAEKDSFSASCGKGHRQRL